MIWHVSFSLYVNKPSAWLEASRKLRFRGECERIVPNIDGVKPAEAGDAYVVVNFLSQLILFSN